MKDTTFRNGHSGDEAWLFELFRTTMQDYIDRAWGWEELLQREGFITSLPAREFYVLEINSQAIGSYHLSRQSDHYLLDIIMVQPRYQRQGYGRLMMQSIQEQARRDKLPLRLRVLQSNPAVIFHRRLGFRECGHDRHSVDMIWYPAGADQT